MKELLQNASDALIANDAVTLERLAEQAASLRTGCGAAFEEGVAASAEVLRRQVLAAALQLATRRRLAADASLQGHRWGH